MQWKGKWLFNHNKYSVHLRVGHRQRTRCPGNHNRKEGRHFSCWFIRFIVNRPRGALSENHMSLQKNSYKTLLDIARSTFFCASFLFSKPQLKKNRLKNKCRKKNLKDSNIEFFYPSQNLLSPLVLLISLGYIFM